MELFKERLKDFGKGTVAFLILVACVGALGAALVGIFWLLEWIHPKLDDILIGAGIVGFILYYIGKCVYWLFIEPFRKKHKEE